MCKNSETEIRKSSKKTLECVQRYKKIISTWLLVVLPTQKRVNPRGKIKKQQKENTCKFATETLTKNIAENNSVPT